MSRTIRVYLGPWDAATASWPCDLATFSGAEVVLLHAGAATKATNFTAVNGTIRWLDAAPPADPEPAFVEVKLPERWSPPVIAALIAAVVSLSGNAVQAISAWRDGCPGDLVVTKEHLTTCNSRTAECGKTIIEVADLCSGADP